MSCNTSPRRTRAAALLGAGAVAAAMFTATAPSADAAATHYNTDPYGTNCADTARIISSYAVPGGKAYVKRSNVCATNWIEYEGASVTTTKSTWDSATNKWTKSEVDTGTVNYSMQSYAPYPTKFKGKIVLGASAFTATCTGADCSWSRTAVSGSTLSAKVDAFVTKYNGKYVDFDGMYGAQCADLAQQFNYEVVGGKRFSSQYTGGAQDYWRTYDTSKYTKVSASSTPRKGDVAIWKAGSATNATYGHVAIVLADGGSYIKTFTQNPGAAHVGNITKQDLLGYLRPVS